MLYGSYESKFELPPLIIPVKDPNFFQLFNPLNGEVSLESDRKIIFELFLCLKEKMVSCSFEMEKNIINIIIYLSKHIIKYIYH